MLMLRSPSDIVLEKFGKFFLLDRIGAGGMAEIFRARPASPEANGRVVVIKRVLPEVSNDPSFLTMFKTEIRTCMAFNHPNLVAIHDFGEVNGRPYLAMEYVEGINLRHLLLAASQKNVSSLPVDMAVGLVEQAARGMHYAHTFENSATGECPRVVHRDISPQNILVSFDGNVKVIDFGIAKASERTADMTRAGTIKGKISYLSPEQARGENVDARSDVFSLGTVLWELLTGKKLFSMPDAGEHAIIAVIRNCEDFVTGASVVNAQVPKELDAILLKALAADRSKRFQSAGEMADALREFLHTFNPKYSTAVAGKFCRDLFGEEISLDKKRLLELNHQAQSIVTLTGGISAGATQITHSGQAQAQQATQMMSAGATHWNPMGTQTFQTQIGQPSQMLDSLTPSPYVRMGAQMAVPMPAVAKKAPWLTPGKLVFAVLYVLTIVFLKFDREYMFFERLTMPAEYVRYAMEDEPTVTVKPASRAPAASKHRKRPATPGGARSTSAD